MFLGITVRKLTVQMRSRAQFGKHSKEEVTLGVVASQPGHISSYLEEVEETKSCGSRTEVDIPANVY